MSLSRRLRNLLRANFGALFDADISDTTLDDEPVEFRSPRLRDSGVRSRPPGRTARRSVSSSRPPRPAVGPWQPSQYERMVELYRILEVPVGADLSVVRQSYRRLLRLYHPDLVGPEAGSAERVQVLIAAYGELRRLLGDR
ncbi:MAG: J domain-containing protein [Myxococcales bacterium]|nr:J domain-containing protein [Myxococcota bacterium]MDW8282641.1 J domain-containing protein [Myxococcales bacterium]